MLVKKFLSFFIFSVFICFQARSQQIVWGPDGNSVITFSEGNIMRVDPGNGSSTILFSKQQLTPHGAYAPLNVQSFSYSSDGKKILLFANTTRVWRKNTRGDYYLLNTASNKLTKVGKELPSQSLMFAKFSPDGQKIAYVSGNNLYVEDVETGKAKKLTNDGSRKMINGTFDWVYEEEFGTRDGFRWSPDSKQLAFWQVDATKIGDYNMVNNIDSVYPNIIPVEYPKVGTPPSPVKIGVVNVTSGAIKWMKFEGDAQQHYIPRMEWANASELIVQRLDRKQQVSQLIYSKVADGSSKTFWSDRDNAWVDLNQADIFDEPGGFNFINNGREFLWVSEKDGWRHIYRISRDGKSTKLITPGNYDVSSILSIDEENGFVYFMASPENPTQNYLYRVKMNGSGPELVSPGDLKGTHTYKISPSSKLAFHSFSNHKTPPVTEWVSLPDHRPVNSSAGISSRIKTDNSSRIEFIQVTTKDNITLDAWLHYPKNFDPAKKYPIVFMVYGEPAGSTVSDTYGAQTNGLYNGDMAADGYFQASVENRGTPIVKGREWRKSIYRKIGVLNVSDYAEGARKIIEKPFIDKDRVAVWGWSGGGSSTLNLMFKYPDLFKTGVAIAAVANQLYYDNIYQERYMGLPQENMEDFVKGSPANNVAGLQGNLLYIHGTGDDNVHYSNAEYLINELVKHGKQFQFMAYPNRSHGIHEGEGTSEHLSALYTNFLRQHCPPGGR